MHCCCHNTLIRQFRKAAVVRIALVLLVAIFSTTQLYAREHNQEPEQKQEATSLESGSHSRPARSQRLPAIPIPMPDVSASIDNAHYSASELLNDFASQLDNFFGEEVTEDIANDTNATIRMDFQDPSNDDFSTTAKLKFRLVLPRSQQRIRLLLDVDEREDDESVQALADEDVDRAFSFAFRFIRNATEKTRFNVDLGARRFDQRFQTFARLRVTTKILNDNGWSFNLRNDLRQFYSSGYSYRTSLNFWHTLNEDQSTIFRSSSNVTWEKIQSGARIDQTFGVYKKLRHKSLLAFEMLAGYNTSPEEDASHYEGHTARIRYRKNIFRPWFHYELWPSISWLTENDGDPRLGGLVRFEVQFGKYR